MPELSSEDRLKVLPVLEKVREQLADLAGDDSLRLHSMRRYIAKRLEFDERGNPAQRRKLKDLMWKKQMGKCAICEEQLPESGTELDRFVAVDGYVEGNVRLVHHQCHCDDQAAKSYR